MTTVLFTKKMVLWDSRMTYGTMPRKTGEQKVQTIGDTIFGISGDYPSALAAIQWWLKGADVRKAPKGEWNLLVWKKGFSVRQYDTDNNLTGLDVQLPHAIGSGSYAVVTALKCGLKPEEAMKIAYKMDVYSGGPTRKLDVEAFFKSVRAGTNE